MRNKRFYLVLLIICFLFLTSYLPDTSLVSKAEILAENSYFAEYFNNMTLQGDPVYSQNEDKINHNWGENSPGYGVNKDQFSIRWIGRFSFEQGKYNFHYKVDDGIRLWIDNTLIIDDWHDQLTKDMYFTQFVSQGVHAIKCEYYENGGGAEVLLDWSLKPKKYKILPILIEFPDVLHQLTADDIYNSLFSTKTVKEDPKNFISVSNYFKEVAGGDFGIEAGSYGVGTWIKMPKNKSVYRDITHYFQFMDDLFKNLEKLKIDLTEYDQDKDGFIDYFVLICSGERENNSWLLWQVSKLGNRKLKNMMVQDCYQTGEFEGGEKLSLTKWLCHEIFIQQGGNYLLSFDSNCKDDPVGAWDFMGFRKWNNFTLSGYSRSLLGWQKQELITETGAYEIHALCSDSPNKLYRINIPDTKEYFLIENRSKVGTDSWWNGIPNEGLVIYHIDESIPVESYFNDGPPRYNHFAVWVENAEKMAYCEDNNHTEFTPTTNPSSRDYKNKSLYDISITDISKAGLLMTFKVKIEKKEPLIPILNIDQKEIKFGLIEKNSKVNQKININNIGTGNLLCKFSPTSELIFITQNETLDNKYEINLSIDTSSNSQCQNEFLIIESNGGYYEIPISFEVVEKIGDLNYDKKTDIDDFYIIQKCYGSIIGESSYSTKADLFFDGIINSLDLFILSQHLD